MLSHATKINLWLHKPSPKDQKKPLVLSLVTFDHLSHLGELATLTMIYLQKLMTTISFLLVSFSSIHSQYFTHIIREVIIFAESWIIFVSSMKNQENSF